MSDLHALSFISVPSDLLAALDNRSFRFAMQPVHHLVRMAHILSVSAFFGAIALFDLRLTGIRSSLSLTGLAELVLPWTHIMFAVAMVSGLLLFFYDPVHVGSHAYFSLKMILIVAGLANAAVFHRREFKAVLFGRIAAPNSIRVFGAISLAIWLGVMICANLNAEAAPKVFLR